MLRTRILTAVVIVAFLAIVLAYGSSFSVAALLIVVSLGCLREYLAMSRPDHRVPRPVLELAAGLLILLYLGSAGGRAQVLALFGFLLCYAGWYQFRTTEVTANLHEIQNAVFGFFYTCILPSFLFVLYQRPHGLWLLVFLVVVVAAQDTGAYFTGRLLGRTKLNILISPGKTLEGCAGGLLLAVVGSELCCFLVGDALVGVILYPIPAALFVAAVGISGDLLESMIKRSAGFKDSGKLLPGHGGLLDRFDGYLLAAPALVLYLQLMA
ncbi:MAG: hypothetical protein A2284_14735 [Deltaproteobacteria bacterium RIFOXYA12_FULL_61_11]|nr:MAG: hypothetical protein A2284_14735 [Deltaproteobacteria bacterium RIFOXYA12_FULL_61_11]